MFGRMDHSCAGREGLRHFAGGGRSGFFGGSGGGFRGGGPGMRTAKMLGSGDLQLIILLLLSEKPRHGYEIIKAVEEHSSGVYTPSPGMVYPALTYLEEMGHAAGAAEGTKKLYSITADGTGYLAEHREAANEVWNQLAIFGRKLAHFRKQFAEDEDVADHFGSGSSAGAKGEWQQMKAEFRGLRDEMKAAIHEKLNSTMEEKRRILDVLRRAVDEIRGK
ncbi:MAG: helix-turn-helix transcriptional regulator [Gammaproteobacteria bacterium]|nr:helix-turn-helix transcriptional regulator [Gammaproteobacteria bacterium]